MVNVMSYELLVGLQVDDRDVYTQYRAEIKPLLQSAGGEFRYDFEVRHALVNSSGHPINRVFVLAFPDADARARFFNDDRYLSIRNRLFNNAVSGTTIIAEYTR